MKPGSNNYRHSPVLDILSRLQARGTEVILHEPLLSEGRFHGAQVIRDLATFKDMADVIVANRVTADLADVSAKVFSRDLFGSG
jgi:UDPglucose 6-dehydrogenase